jgi:hypothetical protein
MYVREVKETGLELIDALEFEKDIISQNISEIIDNVHAEIGRNIDHIISKVKDQVFSVVKRYTGFGLKFAVTSMKICLKKIVISWMRKLWISTIVSIFLYKYGETCLSQTLNKLKSCIHQTLNEVPM